jgi:hypothetical protein
MLSKPPLTKRKSSSSEPGPVSQELACAREASGLAYDNADTFNTLFPGYHDRYGLKTINL